MLMDLMGIHGFKLGATNPWVFFSINQGEWISKWWRRYEKKIYLKIWETAVDVHIYKCKMLVI